jgi:hypothetical protein
MTVFPFNKSYFNHSPLFSSPLHNRVKVRGLCGFPFPAPSFLPVRFLPGFLSLHTFEFRNYFQRLIHLLQKNDNPQQPVDPDEVLITADTESETELIRIWRDEEGGKVIVRENQKDPIYDWWVYTIDCKKIYKTIH